MEDRSLVESSLMDADHIHRTVIELNCNKPSGKSALKCKVINLKVQLDQDPNVSSQTPTPIRFIRNCEESGLFEDLQIVNPFEQGFKKALEQSNIQPCSSETNIEGSLHTPIVPNVYLPETSKVYSLGNQIEGYSNNNERDEGNSDNSDSELHIADLEEVPRKVNKQSTNGVEKGVHGQIVTDVKEKRRQSNRVSQSRFRAKEKTKLLALTEENEKLKKLLKTYQRDIRLLSSYILRGASGQNARFIGDLLQKYSCQEVVSETYRPILPKPSM